MEKIDKILKREGLKYTTINYENEECYLIDSIKLYLYIRESKKSEKYKLFKAIVPNDYYFIWFTKTQVKGLKKIKALTNEEKRKELSRYQDATVVVNHYADKMREQPTKAEDCFAKVLELNGIEYKQQFVINCKVKRYIADFLIGNKVIEIDGKSHKKPKAKEYDQVRTERLEALGYVVLRIDNKDVLKHTDIMSNIINKLKN